MSTVTINTRAKLDAVRIKFGESTTYGPWVAWAMNLPDRVAKEGELPYPTAGTDGREIIWHPEFVDTNSLHELVKVLAHEVAHCTLYHTAGRAKELQKKYGPELSNIALDHAVNNLLVDCGETLTKDWVCDRKYKGWRAEDIAYDLVKDSPPPPPSGKPSSGKGGGHEIMNNATAEQAKQAQERSDRAFNDSSVMDAIREKMLDEGESDGQGSDPMGTLMQSARNARHKPKHWRDELEEFTGSIRDGDRRSTYAHICNRPIPGVLKPGHKREGKPHIGVIIDSSGSMYSDLPKVMVELEFMSIEGFTFDVICTDGNIYGPYNFPQGEFDYQSLPLEGGGGSDMQPAFEHFKEHIANAEALIFCTDGCIDWPSEELLADLPPCILTEFSRTKSEEGKRFHKHLLVRDGEE